MELFLDLTFLSILNLHTVDWSSKFMSVFISNIISVLTLAFMIGILFFYILAYFHLDRETRTKQFAKKYKALLQGTKSDIYLEESLPQPVPTGVTTTEFNNETD